MIRISSNAKEILNRNEKRIKALKQNPLTVVKKIGGLVRDMAKANAPHKTGALASGIIKRDTAEGCTVYAFDPLHRVKVGNNNNWLAWWVDDRVVFTYRKDVEQKVWQGGQTVRYGDSSKLLSGKTARWTGKRGYFSSAVFKARREFGTRMTKALRASMSGVRI